MKIGTLCEATAVIRVKKHEGFKVLNSLPGPRGSGTRRPMRLCFVLLPDSKPLAAAPFEKAVKEFPDLGKVSWLSSTREGTKAFSVGKPSPVTPERACTPVSCVRRQSRSKKSVADSSVSRGITSPPSLPCRQRPRGSLPRRESYQERRCR